MKIYYLTTLLLMAALLTNGCAGRTSVGQWQASVGDSMRSRPDAGFSFLREQPLDNGRRIFRIIGKADPQGSTDQVGILLGHEMVDGQPWFVFLLGTVKDQRLQSARVAALADAADRPRWQMGPPNPQAMVRYEAYRRRRWAGLHPGRANDPQPGFVWPGETDHFQLSMNGSQAVVTELYSHAVWTVNIRPPRQYSSLWTQ